MSDAKPAFLADVEKGKPLAKGKATAEHDPLAAAKLQLALSKDRTGELKAVENKPKAGLTDAEKANFIAAKKGELKDE